MRRQVSLDATLRDEERQPIDVSIEDLSRTGFLMSSASVLPLASIIGIGIAGIAKRDARIVRRAPSGYGCEFLVPITDADIAAAQIAETVVQGAFDSIGSVPVQREEGDAAPNRHELPIPVKLLLILLATAALWTAIIAAIL
jgi:hypothetical protein